MAFPPLIPSWGWRLRFLILLLLSGKVIHPSHKPKCAHTSHSPETTVFCFYTGLSLHKIHKVLCHVVLPWKKSGLKWTSRNKQQREGGSDYVRISLLWVISRAPLSASCCLSLFNGWLHQLVTRWKLLKNGCYGSLPPQDVSVISAIEI